MRDCDRGRRGAGSAPPEPSVCVDARISNGSDLIWQQGNPLVTHDGADQTAPRQAREPGTLAPDLHSLCLPEESSPERIQEIVCACDPGRDSSSAPGVQNDVTIWLDGVYDTYPYQLDPCPNGCTFAVDCVAGDETHTTVDLVLAIEMFNGFFDYVIGFGPDVFGTAKTDCLDLLKGEDGERDPSAIVSTTFDGGVGVQVEHFASRIVAHCGDRAIAFDPTVPGNNSVSVGEQKVSYATYAGYEEPLYDVGKSFLNLAFDVPHLEALGGTCRLDWSVTGVAPTKGVLDAAGPVADVLIQPFFTFSTPLTEDGQDACVAGDIMGSTSFALTYYSNAVRELAPLPARCYRKVGDMPVEATHAAGCDNPL